MIKFPSEETGKQRKLFQPWHGPYRISAIRNPDIVATKVYFPSEDSINVHQLRVTKCPIDFPAGYYWYGRKQHSSGKIPGWLEDLQRAAVTQDIAPRSSTGDDDASVEVDVEQANSADNDTGTGDDHNAVTKSRSNAWYALRAQVKRPTRFK